MKNKSLSYSIFILGSIAGQENINYSNDNGKYSIEFDSKINHNKINEKITICNDIIENIVINIRDTEYCFKNEDGVLKNLQNDIILPANTVPFNLCPFYHTINKYDLGKRYSFNSIVSSDMKLSFIPYIFFKIDDCQLFVDSPIRSKIIYKDMTTMSEFIGERDGVVKRLNTDINEIKYDQ